jgi:uncharacterized protein
MTNNRKIELTEDFVRQRMIGYDSGHDWWHIVRVRRLALYINEREFFSDPLTLEIAACLHDLVDSKFTEGKTEQAVSEIAGFLNRSGMSGISARVLEVIGNVSFSRKDKSGNLNDPVLLILQDADRLDAMGAIGIARAFNYGGFRNNGIYIPDDDDPAKESCTISHFYSKLLRLKDLMNTATGRSIAIERHAFLENYLRQFLAEWQFAT